MSICHMSTFVPATNCAGDAWVLIGRGIHVCIACSMFVERHSRSVQLLVTITTEDFLVVLVVLVAWVAWVAWVALCLRRLVAKK